jgi:hypothetical protein
LGVLPDVVGTPHEQVEQLVDAITALPSRPWLHGILGLDRTAQPR